MTPQALETRELAVGYRRRGKPANELARGLNLHLQRGKLVGLLGPNGVGKSTLLRTLAGMHKPLSGDVWLAGDDLAMLKPNDLAQRLSLVLTAAPYPGLMNGYALVALGRHPHTDWLGRLSERDHEIVSWAIGAVDANDLATKPVAELSDGQRQKLMIARALAQEGDVMLLDEPTAYLDLPRRVETMQLLRQLAREADRAILISTHDLDLALRNCDSLWLMNDTGIVVGAPEDLVLSGSLAETFRADGTSFDQRNGAFVPEMETGQAVRVSGDGSQAIWTRRALERIGYAIQDAPGKIEVSCAQNGVLQWQLRIDQATSVHSSIEDVLKALEGQSA